MKKLIFNICAVVMTMLGLGGVAALSPVVAEPAYAVTNNSSVQDWVNEAGGTDATGSSEGLMGMIKNIINIVLGVVGIVAVVMMIMGGISFITSQGDAGKVTKARNTILYGVVGLIVALLAFAIVNFVLTNIA